MSTQEWQIRNRKRNRPKRHLVTGVWQYGGFCLNLKLLLYLQSQCLTESLGFLNPPHRQAPKRFSQEKVEITKEGITNTEQIIKLDSLTAKEIYSRINKYIQKNYTNPDAVSKGNVENEFISFNGIKRDCLSQKILLSTFYSDLEYYFNIDIKDGKIKITISKLIKIDDDNHKTDLFTMNGFGYFKNDGTIRSLYSKVKITRWVQLFFKEKFINIGTRH